MTDNEDLFGRFSGADAYEDAVDKSIAFAHVGHELFVRVKAEALLDLMRRHFGSTSDLDVIDVGCGVGAMQRYVSPEVGRSVGVDASAETAETAKRLCPTSEIVALDGGSIPFEDGSFDVAFAVNVLHHVETGDRERFAADLRRLVRAGGLVVVFEHNPANPLTRLAVARCEFDKGVSLLSRARVGKLLGGPTTSLVDQRYILFFPFESKLARRLEQRLGWLPLGAQHMVGVAIGAI